MEGDPSYGQTNYPVSAPVYPYPQSGTSTTTGVSEQDVAPGGPIYDALKRYLGYTDEQLAEYDDIDMLDLYQQGQEIGLIPKPKAAGTGDSASLLTAQALLNPELIDLTPQGLPGRAILRGTDQIIDLRQPGQYKPISGLPNVYYDSVTGETLDREGNIIRREELGLARENLALDTELGRGNLAVSEQRLGLEGQRQGFEQQYQFPEQQRQFNVGATRDYDLAGDTNRRLVASDVLGNAVTLQGQQDQRGFTAARLSADPGNFVEREYVSRGLTAPQQGQAPLFSTVPQVQQGFDSLSNYRPTPVPQLSATIPGTVLPVTNPLGMLPQTKLPIQPPPKVPQPVIAPDEVLETIAEVNQGGNEQAILNQDNPNIAGYGTYEGLAAINEAMGLPPPYQPPDTRMAYGGVTRASNLMVGDPQQERPTTPNPEIIGNPTGAPLSVTPINRMASQLGNSSARRYPSRRPQMSSILPGMRGTALPQQAAPQAQVQLARRMSTPVQSFPEQFGGSMPQLNFRLPAPDIYTPVESFTPRPELPSMSIYNLDWDPTRTGEMPAYAYGTDETPTESFNRPIPEFSFYPDDPSTTGLTTSNVSPSTVTQANPNPTVPINTDESIQNIPTLRYLQGTLDKGTYGNLSTGTVSGAFGTKLPEAGAINFSKIMQIAQDPVALKMLDSLYRSASRSLSAEVERARARAPIGSAPVSSLVRT